MAAGRFGEFSVQSAVCVMLVYERKARPIFVVQPQARGEGGMHAEMRLVCGNSAPGVQSSSVPHTPEGNLSLLTGFLVLSFFEPSCRRWCWDSPHLNWGCLFGSFLRIAHSLRSVSPWPWIPRAPQKPTPEGKSMSPSAAHLDARAYHPALTAQIFLGDGVLFRAGAKLNVVDQHHHRQLVLNLCPHRPTLP